jgi:hypothetical protein
MDVDAPRSVSRPRSVAFAPEAAASGAAPSRDEGASGSGAGGSGAAAADKSSTLWGPEAVRALRAPRALVDAVRPRAGHGIFRLRCREGASAGDAQALVPHPAVLLRLRASLARPGA